MDRLLLTTGLTVELGKHTAVTLYNRLYQAVSKWATKYDTDHPKPVRCSRDLLCESTRRHSRKCPSHNEYSCDCWHCQGKRMPFIEGTL